MTRTGRSMRSRSRACFRSCVKACEPLASNIHSVMARLFSLTVSLLALVSYGLSTPLRLSDPPRRPLVIWHGLGDSYASPGMLQFMQLIKDVHPGMFIHSVRLDEDLEKDQKAGFVSRFQPSARRATSATDRFA